MLLEVPLIDWDLLNWDTNIRKQGNQSQNDYKAYRREITNRPGCLDANGKWMFFCLRNRVLEMFCKQDLDCSTHLLFMKACDLCHTQNDSIIILSQDLNHSCRNVLVSKLRSLIEGTEAISTNLLVAQIHGQSVRLNFLSVWL